MRWTVHIEGGPRRVNHAAVCIGDKIFSFGGYCSTEEYKDWEPIPIHVLDTSTLRWSPVYYKKTHVMPFQRYGHTTVAYGDKVYMWGGRNNAVACDTLLCFDTKRLEWSMPTVSGIVPYAKDGHSACVIRNKMYIFGGFEYLTDQYSQEVHCLDLDTLQWSFVNVHGSPPSQRDFHTAVPIGDRMYIFGGRGDLNSPYNSQEEVYCPQVFYLDTVKDEWVVANPQGTWPEGRRSHSAWYHGDYMYIFGGFNGNTKTHFNDLYRYSINGNYWQYINVSGVKPCQRRRQACLLYNNKLYLFGGTSPCPHVSGRPVETPEAADNPERLIDNSDLHILDYSPTLKTLCILKVLEQNLDQTYLPRDIIKKYMVHLVSSNYAEIGIPSEPESNVELLTFCTVETNQYVALYYVICSICTKDARETGELSGIVFGDAQPDDVDYRRVLHLFNTPLTQLVPVLRAQAAVEPQLLKEPIQPIQLELK